jgi:pectinesterase
MKRTILGSMMLTFALAAGAAAQTLSVRTENTLTIARADETIGVPWSQVTSRLPAATPARVRVVDAASGQQVPSQAVDNDGDGTIDELIFQSTFGPREVRRFTVEAAAPAPSTAKPRVFAMHTEPRDDVAWESDRIGFRIYGQGLWKVD